MPAERDYRISRWTAEFADSATEADFRKAIEAAWARATRIAMAVAALVFFAFTLTDYLNMGTSQQYAVVFLTRLGISLFGLAAAFYAKRFAVWLVNGTIPTVVVFTALCAFVLIAPYRGLTPGWLGMSMMTMLLGIYVFIPNRFSLSIALGLLGTAGFLWQVVLRYPMEWNFAMNYLLLLAVTNLLGGITVYRVNWQLREQYISTLTLREANTHLQHEIGTRQALEARLRDIASLDDLTGIANRRQFFERAERELAAAQRRGQKLSLLLLDIDYFRQINDRYGHVRSDEVLRTLVRVCQGYLQEGEWLARFGGEELVAVLPRLVWAEAIRRAEDLRQAVEQAPTELADATLTFTISIGVAELRPDESLGMLLRRADAALNTAKAAGRNQVNGTPAAFPA